METISRIFAPNVRFRNGQLVRYEEDGVTVQEIITTSDTKQFFSTAINQFFMTDNPNDDRQWEQIYTIMPSNSHGELLPFRPPDSASSGSHGIVFEQVGEGGEIKFSRVVSAEKYVKNVKYATAIGYSNEWFSDGQMGLIEMVTQDFRDAAADKLASIHYSAIVAAVTSGISDTTSLSGTGTSNVAKLINTLNSVTATMIRAKRRPSIILSPPECEQLVNLALKHTVEGGPLPVVQNSATGRLTPIITEYLADNQTIYVIEPKRRLISTDRLPLTLGNFSDLLHDAEALVGKFRRGVLVGEGAVIHAITNVPKTVTSANDF